MPDFCFCCGLIGDQYKECDKYKGQSKDKLAYGVWMQAIPLIEKYRASRIHERGQKASASKVGLSSNEEDTHVAAYQGSNVKEENKAQLMHSLQELRKQTLDCNKQPSTTDNERALGKMRSKAGKGKENERENGKLATEGELAIVGLEIKN